MDGISRPQENQSLLRARRKRLAVAFGATLSWALIFAIAPPAAANAPLKGHKAWAVVLCKFADQPGTPHPVQWYQDFVTHPAPNKDGLWDFWYDVSYGQLDLNGSQVFGWNTLPNNLMYYKSKDRFTLWKECAETVGKDLSPTDRAKLYNGFYGFLAMLNAAIDMGAVATGQKPTTLNGVSSAWGAVVLDSNTNFVAQDVSSGAHEMGHAFGLNHNYDTKLTNCTDQGPGDYCDPYDAMGYENSWNTFPTSFGNSAPGLTAPNLAKLGWINPQVADPSTPGEYGLSAIEKVPNTVQVPITDSTQQKPHYYTVEYRDPGLPYASGTEWDQKLPGPSIVIHEVRPSDPQGNAYSGGLFYLVDDDKGGAPLSHLCQSFVGVNDIQITAFYLPPVEDIWSVVRVGYAGDRYSDPDVCRNFYLPPPPVPSCAPGWKWCTKFSPPECMLARDCLVYRNRVDSP